LHKNPLRQMPIPHGASRGEADRAMHSCSPQIAASR
jgi:hypothetical protein